ncbi:polysaccharide deacetylase family protein [Solibacillus sp. FSL H8-0538]|uniref:polysaccharide deacetylase family protein n=1 Tax=Solibacillus sp. FSL H8-0538 TaxID=2921400 RepID=UPI0030F7AE72
MENNPRRKRGPWIDITLISSIIALIAVIVFFAIITDDFKFQKTSASEKESSSDLTEEDSAFPGVRIATDISNDKEMPFALQYPLTNFDSFNEAVTTYIQLSKERYINAMRLQNNANPKAPLPGELNISFETYQYDEHYYSFVFTKNTSLNSTDYDTSIETFFLNNETGEMLDIRTLLNKDLKSLETFAAHIRSEIMKKPELQGLVSQEQLTAATEPKWRLFKRFALKDDSLIIYFDKGEIADGSAGIPVVKVSLSFINPLLASEFQIQMAAEETTIPHAGDATKKRVALTFDDGPHPKVTKQILSLLEKYNAKATFFMLGSRVQYYPDIVKEIQAKEHEIGNHTWNHPVLPNLTSKQVLHEYKTTEKAITNILGVAPTLFRPPYGATNERIKELIPIPSVNWTIDTLDWKHRDATKLLPIIQNNMHNNAIILMHDIHQSTADGLEEILIYLQNTGYEFVTVSEILPYN